MQISKNSIDEYFRNEIKLISDDEIIYCFIFDGIKLSLFPKIKGIEFSHLSLNILEIKNKTQEIIHIGPDFTSGLFLEIKIWLEEKFHRQPTEVELGIIVFNVLGKFCRENFISFSLKNKS